MKTGRNWSRDSRRGGWDHDGQAGPCLETLESRVLLSAFTFGSVEAALGLPGSLTSGVVTGGSEDLSFIFASAAGALPGGHEEYAFINGQYTPQSEIPGLVGEDVILAVNNSHTIVGRTVTFTEGVYVQGVPFIIENGVRVLLTDAVTEVVGGPAPVWERMEVAGIGNDGTIIFNQRPDPTSALSPNDRAWVYKDGVLTLLWNGLAYDVNDSGAVVGASLAAGGEGSIMLRTAGGETVEVAGLLRDYRVAIDDLGRVYGIGEHLGLARWEAGAVTPLTPAPAVNPDGSVPIPTIIDASDDGEVVARLHSLAGRSSILERLMFTPDDGLKLLSTFIVGDGGEPTFPGEPIRFLDGGQVLTMDGVMQPVDEMELWSFAAGSPVGAVDGAVMGVSEVGAPVLLVESGGAWRGVRPTIYYDTARGPEGREITEIVLARQPHLPGGIFVLVIADGESYFGTYAPGTDSLDLTSTDDAAPGATVIVSSPTVFETADGRLVVAGVDGSGDLVIYYHTSRWDPGTPAANTWSFDNLTDGHLEARGQEFTPVAGDLTSFSTPWGTNHIGYLDADGEVHVVWWGPGDPLWRTDQISFAETSGPLSGRLTSFVTPWHTLHFNAMDAAGDVTAVWWAPGFGGEWATTVLAEGGPRLDPATVTSFHTPWHVLSIVGLDAETGEPTVYWWAPATQEWRAEPIELVETPEGFEVDGPVAAAVTGSSQNLFVRQGNGEVAWLFWNVGDGAAWNYANLTAAAAGVA